MTRGRCRVTPDFCAQAKYYAALGLRVLPIPSGRKGPPLLQDWPQKATTEPETISGWWSTWPQAGIGVAMGAGSALVDIESDIKPGVDGEKSLEGLALPDTWSFRSGGGGTHRLFRCDNPDIPNRVNMLPGVDVRANGGYAVFPPSRHPSGKYYTWLPGHSPQNMPQGPAPLPFELFSMIMETEKKAPLEVPQEIQEGGRNDLLFRQACKLRRDGLTEAEILAAIRAMNDGRCIPPLDDNEVETICRQAAKYEAGDLPEARNGENTFTARELMAAELGETRYIVVDLLPQGLSLLASPPKYGKSWLVLDLCISAAQGGLFLGHPVNKCGVLYLALEDGPRRLKKRMKKLLDGKPAPDNLIFKTEAPDLSNGLLDVLELHMQQHPDTGMIAIDTLQTIRGPSSKNESAYQYDYREMRELKAFADRHGLLLLLVHHLRKMKDEADPHNQISGTNGILGAADTSLVLMKEKKMDHTATLSVTGRDVESSDTVLEFDTETCRWKPLGDLLFVSEQEAQRRYEENPIVKTIKALLEQNGGKWRGSMTDLMEWGRDIARVNLAESPRRLSEDVKRLESDLYIRGRIAHRRPQNGKSGGGPHVFYNIAAGEQSPEDP